MNDDVDIPREDAAGEVPEGPLGGERLAEARRTKQVSVLEIAKELHLDESKVRALERNEFDVLGAPVFAKGYLKKYAQLVQVDPDDVLTDYYKLNRSATAPPVVSTRPKPRQELSPGPWIAAIVVVVVAATGYFWLSSTAFSPLTLGQPGDGSPVVEAALEEGDAAAPEPADASTPGVTLPVTGNSADDETVDEERLDEEPVAEEEEPANVEPEPAAEPTPQPALEAGQMRMLVTFSGDCWTEISDATGRRLLFALGKDGQTVELSGTAPFNVLFGNPDNVSVRVDAEAFELPATRPGRALRLTIPGS
jgi:cytoskeleton protein RodZ